MACENCVVELRGAVRSEQRIEVHTVSASAGESTGASGAKDGTSEGSGA